MQKIFKFTNLINKLSKRYFSMECLAINLHTFFRKTVKTFLLGNHLGTRHKFQNFLEIFYFSMILRHKSFSNLYIHFLVDRSCAKTCKSIVLYQRFYESFLFSFYFIENARKLQKSPVFVKKIIPL